jgi:error-prone DNA polymerase
MPEVMFPKLHPHPRNRGPATDASDGTDGEQRRRPDPGDRPGRPVGSRPRVQYAELAVTSNFTFLTGGSHPEEFVERAAALDHAAAAIADRNSLAGIVRAHVTAKRLGLPLAIGSRLRFTDGLTPDILVFAASRVGYANLSTLLTVGKRRAPKGECHLALHDLLAHQAGLLAVVDPPPTLDTQFVQLLEGLRQTFDDDRLSIACRMTMEQGDASRLQQLRSLADHVHVPLAATNDVHYHRPERRPLQDVLTCIRHGCTLDEAGLRLLPNAFSLDELHRTS